MTLRHLANRSGLSHSYISEIEHGKANPSLKTIESLAKGLGVNANAILVGKNMAPKKPEPPKFSEPLELAFYKIINMEDISQFVLFCREVADYTTMGYEIKKLENLKDNFYRAYIEKQVHESSGEHLDKDEKHIKIENAVISKETAKAFLVFNQIWLPKKVVSLDNGSLIVPEWLYDKKLKFVPSTSQSDGELINKIIMAIFFNEYSILIETSDISILTGVPIELIPDSFHGNKRFSKIDDNPEFISQFFTNHKTLKYGYHDGFQAVKFIKDTDEELIKKTRAKLYYSFPSRLSLCFPNELLSIAENQLEILARLDLREKELT